MPRLDHLLARNLGCSRGEARRLIEDGRVTAGGAPVDARAIAPAEVLLDGEPLRLVAEAHLMLNKPAGVVTALADARHPTAYALLREAPLHPELRPVGRLDLETTGLLLWTSEGALVQRLTHPRRRLPRTYQAALARPHRPLEPGLTLEDGHRPEVVELAPLAPAARHPSLAEAPGATAWATVTIIGGAYHEVRRIFAALGSHVLALCRVRFGHLELPRDLPPGAWREVEPGQII